MLITQSHSELPFHTYSLQKLKVWFRECHHRGKVRKPQPLPSHKDQQLDSSSQTKIALGELRNLLKQLQQHKRTKIPENNHMKKEGRTASFCLPHPILEADIAQHQERTPQLKRVPCPRKGGQHVGTDSLAFWNTVWRIHFGLNPSREQQS